MNYLSNIICGNEDRSLLAVIPNKQLLDQSLQLIAPNKRFNEWSEQNHNATLVLDVLFSNSRFYGEPFLAVLRSQKKAAKIKLIDMNYY
jgi:hypothetical protein